MARAQAGLIYKITTVDVWAEALAHGVFVGSPDDVRDGYIHLSAGHQLAATARKYFSGVAELLLVAFQPKALGDELKWEPSRGGDLFPHYYGALDVGNALWVAPLPLDETGMPRVADILSL